MSISLPSLLIYLFCSVGSAVTRPTDRDSNLNQQKWQAYPGWLNIGHSQVVNQADLPSYSRDEQLNDGLDETAYHHFLPEDENVSSSLANIDSSSNAYETVAPTSSSNRRLVAPIDTGSPRLFQANNRRLDYLRSRLRKHTSNKDAIEQMLINEHPLVCQYEKIFKEDQRKRDRKCGMRKQLEKYPHDIELHRQILEEYGETPQEFLKGRRPKGSKVFYNMSEKRRAAVRDVYRSLQRDIKRYNETQKTKQPYDMTYLQTKKQMEVEEQEHLKEEDLEADAMVKRMQDLRTLFCEAPRDESIVPTLIEMDAWMKAKDFKRKQLILPHDFTELTL